MAAIVHQTCAGKVALSITIPQHKAHSTGVACCTWLAKHAQLLRSLHVEFDNDCASLAQDYVAAGLRAAAGARSMRPGSRTPGQRADVDAQATMHAEDLAKSALEAANAMASPLPPLQPPQPSRAQQAQQWLSQQQQHQQHQRGPLPLLSLHLQGAVNDTMVRGFLAACPRLTQLQLQITDRSQMMHQPSIALHALPDLQELLLAFPPGASQTLHNLYCLKDLSKLTKLHLPSTKPFSTGGLPPSVVDLCLQGDVGGERLNLKHLTNLQRLQCGVVSEPQLLPPGLQQLCMDNFSWNGSLLQLPPLDRVELLLRPFCTHTPREGYTFDLERVTELTQLTALAVTLEGVTADDKHLYQALRALPLVELNLHRARLGAMHVAALECCTRLTSLRLTDVHMEVRPSMLVYPLEQLQQLQLLECGNVSFDTHPMQAVEWRPLVQGVKRLGSLQRLRVSGWTLSPEQLGELWGLTRLSFDYQSGRVSRKYLKQVSSQSLFGAMINMTNATYEGGEAAAFAALVDAGLLW